jgi:sugar phosphate isomerase/epimerase
MLVLLEPVMTEKLNAAFAPATRLLWASGVLGALESIARAGFQGAEVWAHHLWDSRTKAEEAGRLANELGLRLSVHAPAYDLNPLSSNPEIRAVSQRQVLGSLEDAHLMGAGLVVVHPGALSSSTDDPEEYWGRLEDFAGQLNERAASLGLTIGIEGMERKRLQFVTDLPALERLSAILERNGLDRVGITLDVAHAATLGDPIQFVMNAPRVVHGHLSDNSERKTHALLGEGKVDLSSVIPALLARLPGGMIAIEGRFAADEMRALARAREALLPY